MKKIRRSILFFLLALTISGCASTAPLPVTLNIVTPLPDVPLEIAAFSGIWEGKWNSALDTILVVERIDTQKAEIIISLGDAGGYFIQPQNTYFYVTAPVIPGPVIEWTNANGNKFTFKMDKDLNKVIGFFEEKTTGSKARVAYMTRRKVK